MCRLDHPDIVQKNNLLLTFCWFPLGPNPYALIVKSPCLVTQPRHPRLQRKARQAWDLPLLAAEGHLRFKVLLGRIWAKVGEFNQSRGFNLKGKRI